MHLKLNITVATFKLHDASYEINNYWLLDSP